MPKVVNIEKVKAENLIEMSPIDFLEYIEDTKVPIIFKDSDSYSFMKDGFYFYTYHYNSYENFDKFRQYLIEIKKAGFNSPELYESSKSFGKFDNQDDYIRFSNGGFSPHYGDYIGAKKGGFVDYNEFREAKLLGIKKFDEFLRFKNSEYYNDKYASRIFQFDIFTQKHKVINTIAYKQFKEAKQ